MAEFYITLPQIEMATQISQLLNSQNRLYTFHTNRTIMNGMASYFVEVSDGKVVGCTALLKEFPTLSKSFHTSVSPTHKRRGLAVKLLSTAIANCDTPHIYGTIREDNVPSLNLVEKLGWKFIRKEWNKDHYVITMAGRVK
jgi:RimJ/RimL family protein N-acetyltransferase